MNSQLFYKAMSGFYDLLDIVYFRKYESSPRKVVFEAIDAKDRVLDLCTGTATNAVAIAKQNPSVRVVGVDLSKDMLIVAKHKMQDAKVRNVCLKQMDATAMTFSDETFDKVLLSLVLHETEETLVAKIVSEAVRVLKADGELIVTEWERPKKLFDKVLFAPIELLEPKPYKAFVEKDLSSYFGEFGLYVAEEIHCDYSKVLRLKKR